MVQNDSPVFALFDYYPIRRNLFRLGDYMDHASSQILQFFNHGKSPCHPHDVGEDGQTIPHVSGERGIPPQMPSLPI
jgi:hypothetical protein